MDKYSKHFLLNVDTAKEYAVEKVGYFKIRSNRDR